MGSNGQGAYYHVCTQCQTKFPITLPRVEVKNEDRYSMAMAPHEKPLVCPSCGKSYKFVITQCVTNWGAEALSEEQRRQIEGTDIITL